MSLANLKKGDTVILHMFTGVAVGVKEVLKADKTTVTLETRVGMAKFSRKTGKQIEPPAKKERFANFITEDDGSYEPAAKPKKKKSAKPKTKKPVGADDEEDDEDEKPVKKASKKPSIKKKSKPDPDDDEDEDFDDYEEEDDEED